MSSSQTSDIGFRERQKFSISKGNIFSSCFKHPMGAVLSTTGMTNSFSCRHRFPFYVGNG